MFAPLTDVEDGVVMKIVQALLKITGMALEQLAEAFGYYWVNR